jgi:AraC-like DNA-binding protein
VIVDTATAAPLTAVGTMTRPLLVPGTQRTTLVGVRLRPGRASLLFGVPADELTDLRVRLADLWGRAAAPERPASLAREWEPEPPSVRRSVAALADLLTCRFALAGAAPPEIDEAARRIAAARGNVRIAALGPALGVTRQHLARQFSRHVGVTPKTFARVVRLRYVLERVRAPACVDWSAIALSHGYCDQAHLVGEFKELTGLTPTQWTERR